MNFWISMNYSWNHQFWPTIIHDASLDSLFFKAEQSLRSGPRNRWTRLLAGLDAVSVGWCANINPIRPGRGPTAGGWRAAKKVWATQNWMIWLIFGWLLVDFWMIWIDLWIVLLLMFGEIYRIHWYNLGGIDIKHEQRNFDAELVWTL